VLARSRPGASAGLSARGSTERVRADVLGLGPSAHPGGRGPRLRPARAGLRGHELGSAFRMAMAGALVQAHGGRATVGSLSGRTLFQLVLPPPR
jgi:hypothetical protein